MNNDPSSHVGLCASCRFARVQRSQRGGEFWRCQRADTEESFLRYPPLPVQRCEGYVALAADAAQPKSGD